MREVSSQALGDVARALNLAGPGGSQTTEFNEGLLEQVFNVAPMIRRGMTLANSEGLYAARITNVHVGAGDITGTASPYAEAGAQHGYPNPMPRGMEVWLLGVNVGLSALTLIDECQFRINFPATGVGFGATGTLGFSYAGFDTDASLGGGLVMVANGDVSTVTQGFPLRLNRAVTIQFLTHATAAVSAFGNMIIGVFPVGLGQDIRG